MDKLVLCNIICYLFPDNDPFGLKHVDTLSAITQCKYPSKNIVHILSVATWNRYVRSSPKRLINVSNQTEKQRKYSNGLHIIIFHFKSNKQIKLVYFWNI